jgi:hypothetical protein
MTGNPLIRIARIVRTTFTVLGGDQDRTLAIVPGSSPECKGRMAPGQPDSGTIYRELPIADLDSWRPLRCPVGAVMAATAPTSVPEKRKLSFTEFLAEVDEKSWQC